MFQTHYENIILSRNLNDCMDELNKFQGKLLAEALDKIYDELSMTSDYETSPDIINVMLVWPHWYRTLFVDTFPAVQRSTHKLHALIATKVLQHPMNLETKKLSGPWILWCYWSLNKNAPWFVQKAFKISYPKQNATLDSYHEDLINTLHFNLHSLDQIVAFVVQHKNYSLLGLAIASLKTVTVLITHFPAKVITKMSKLKPTMQAIRKMHHDDPFLFGSVTSAPDFDTNKNALFLFRTACQECVAAAHQFAPFLLTAFVPDI